MNDKIIDGCAVAAVVAGLMWTFSPQELTQAQTYPIEPREPITMGDVRAMYDLKLDALINGQNETHDTLADHSLRLERIEKQLEEPATEPEPPQPNLTLYTSDSSWSCGACRVQQRNLTTTKPTCEWVTVRGPSEGQPPTNRNGRRVYPTWELTRADGTKELKHGALTTKQINDWVGQR